MASGNVHDILDRVRTSLDRGNAEEALAVVAPQLRSGSKLVISAYAACLLRLGQYEEAMKMLRDLVYQGSSLALASDIPTVVKTNFATALILTQNVDGAEAVLNQLGENSDEVAARLKAAIARWKKSLTLWQRLQRAWGTPNRPVVLDFPPGNV